MSFFDSGFFDPAFFDTATAAPTITAVTASNITQTGATITISRTDPAAGTLPYAAGDRIRFTPITKAEFNALAQKEGTV